MKKVMYLDLETSGVDANNNGIITLSGIVEIDGKRVDEIDLRINPSTYCKDVLINDQALAINGFTREDLTKFGHSGLVFTDFIDFANKHVNRFDKQDKMWICGYNSQFDTAFLRAWFADNGNQFYGAYFYQYDIDVFALIRFMQFYGAISLENLKLETVCKHFDIPLEAHNAKSDIEATILLAKKLQGAFNYDGK